MLVLFHHMALVRLARHTQQRVTRRKAEGVREGGTLLAHCCHIFLCQLGREIQISMTEIIWLGINLFALLGRSRCPGARSPSYCPSTARIVHGYPKLVWIALELASVHKKLSGGGGQCLSTMTWMYLHNCNCKSVKYVLSVWLAPPAYSLLSQQSSADQVALTAHTAQESHGLSPCVKCGGPSLESSNLLSVNHLGQLMTAKLLSCQEQFLMKNIQIKHLKKSDSEKSIQQNINNLLPRIKVVLWRSKPLFPVAIWAACSVFKPRTCWNVLPSTAS